MYTDERKYEIRIAVTQSHSVAGVLRCLGLKPRGSNYRTVQKYIREMGLDISHFTGQAHLRGKTRIATNKMPLSKILVLNSFYNSFRLSKRLVSEGLMERRCAKCGRTKWEGRIIPIELDHINGISTDNRIKNLRLVCPNCHALTENYRGRNIKVEKKKYLCSDCGCNISAESKSGLCIRCVKKTIDIESLFKCDKKTRMRAVEFAKKTSQRKAARKFGVSGPTIKRWMGA